MKKKLANIFKDLLPMLLSAIAVACFPYQLYAQSLKITGVVYDVKKEPMVGVTVIVKNTKLITSTDAKGNFSINAQTGQVLSFSYLGFTTQDILIDGKKSSYSIVLIEQSSTLNQVVVVGYGEVKKADLTGSVGILNVAETIEKAPVASLDQALAGRIAGVQVSMSQGQPGKEGVDIKIRGAGSLTQSTAPLYVVDGFANEYFDIGSLNINDIESINVLKDASAIAIYGARGANGVIIVETKKGKVESPVITYNGSQGYQQLWQRMEMMSPYEYVKYEVERGFGSVYIDPTGATKRPSLESYRDLEGIDWQDQLFRTGTVGIHNIAVRGGTNQTRYAISASLYNNEAVIVNTGSTRYQGRISIDQGLNKKIRTGINLNYTANNFFGTDASVTNRDAASVTSYLLYNTLGYRPISGSSASEASLVNSLIDVDIDPTQDYRVNPILSATNEYNKTWNTTLYANGYLTYEIIKGLTFKATGTINTSDAKREYFYNSNTAQGNPFNPQNFRGQWGGKVDTDRFTWSNENTLTYRKRFNKNHNFDAMLGFSSQKTSLKIGNFSSINVGNEMLGVNGLTSGTPYQVGSYAAENSLLSYLARVNYDYKSKYLLTISARADGSSKFPVNKKWGYFPSAALAWKVSSEPFMKDIKFMSDAKLRLSYGLVGNNRVDDYSYQTQISQIIDASYSWNNASPTLGAMVSRLGNADLTWETSKQFDLGLDVSFFKKRIELIADVYRRDTRDLLLNAAMPKFTGFPSAFRNIGAIRNQGLELTLNTINYRNANFSWETNFNITFNQNKVLALSDNELNRLETISWNQSFINSPLYITEVGQPAGQFLGFIWDGNYQYSDFDQTAPGVYKLKAGVPDNGNAAVQPGDIKYRDINGDGTVNELDRTIIGRGTPIHTGGFSNIFRYKNFDLNVFLQWSYGNDLVNANRLMFEGTSLNLLNQFATYVNRWTPENQNNEHYRTNGYGPLGRYSTKIVEDGSYLRLKTVSVGYRIPSKILSKYKLKGLSITAAAQNLLTLTKYSGFDPEVSTRNSVLTPGFDYSAYPQARTVVFGINATF
jgi:TonB-linked SusC/RagA family outer membrane protein